MFRVGSLDVLPLVDGHNAFPAPPTVTAKADAELAAHRRYLPPDGRWLCDYGPFLVRTGDRVELLDAGLGPPATPSGVWDPSQAPEHSLAAMAGLFRGFGRSEEYIRTRMDSLADSTVTYGKLEGSLREAGVEPAEVTDVVVTHLHCDHMGWVARNGVPFFPRARIWCHGADVDHFLGADPPDETHFLAMYGVAPTKDRMAPVLGQLETWTTDLVIAPGIELRHFPGHTPGSAVVSISSEGQRGLMVGDVVHCPLELTDLGFSIAADLDPEAAALSRRRLAAEAAQPGTLVFSTHFPGLTAGRLMSRSSDEPTDRSWEWEWE